MTDKSRARYLDHDLPVEERVQDLLSRMTLEEKIMQMGMYGTRSITDSGNLGPYKEKLGRTGIGAIHAPMYYPEEMLTIINGLQKYLVENTRLGIPALFVDETLHGFVTPGATMFPHMLGLSCSWDDALVKEVAQACAAETRSAGVSQGLAPVLDLARDPRWGRVEETYGEDPYLCTKMGTAYVKGLQGENAEKEGIGSNHIIATLKHFTAHGTPEGGLNTAPVQTGERQLRELYLVPFKAAVTEAGALSVMPAYSELDGIPCSVSKRLLTGILREEWGFSGYTISDFEAIDRLIDSHRVAGNMAEACKKSVEAGMDMEAPNMNAYKEMFNLVETGQMSIESIDKAVSRILRVKFLAGLFENPYGDPENAKRTVNCSKHKELALKAAQESIVLLKNDGGILPLDKKLKRIAVIGPNAGRIQLGGYSVAKDDALTLHQAIRYKVQPDTEVTYAQGCGLYELDRDGLDEAVELASRSDVAVVALGTCSKVNGGKSWRESLNSAETCGERHDVADLDLTGLQQELAEKVIATGTPTIIILINGRPLSIRWLSENAPAIIEAWYPGEEGGNAIADILFGDVNPSGRLTVSFPKTVGQIPVYYNHKPTARGVENNAGSPGKPGMDYVFLDTRPLYEFGYGLSYTSFEYSNLMIAPEKIKRNENVTIKVTVGNTGHMEGKEVVQLYINDVVSSVTTPVKALKGFKKISLKPGEQKCVEFVLTPEDLSIIDENMQTVVEPGRFKTMVGDHDGYFEVI